MVYIQRALQAFLIISAFYLLIGLLQALNIYSPPSIFYNITMFIMGFFVALGSLISSFPPYK